MSRWQAVRDMGFGYFVIAVIAAAYRFLWRRA